MIANHVDSLPALDIVLPTVTVNFLETGQAVVYHNMSTRRALLIAYFQFSRRDWATWNYDELFARYDGLVYVGPSGITASIDGGGTTYCCILPANLPSKETA